MNGSSGGPLIVAAVILGLCVLGGAFLVKSSLDAGTEELAGVSTALDEFKTALAAAARPQAPPQAAAQPGRPDPSRRYEIAIDGSPVKGPDGAKVTLVEFSDFQCPFCNRVNPTLKQIEQEYAGKVRIVFKHLPLRIHPKAPAAHAASVAAHKQGKFWEMHDKIFGNQREMSPEKYVEYATELGLDVEKFKQDVASAETKKVVDRDMAQAEELGVSGTPAFFINGRYLSGAQPLPSFKRIIDEELKQG